MSSDGAVFIERFGAEAGPGPLVAVKDLIDVAGSVTTAGCRALSERAEPAARDAPCITAVRRAGGRLAGKVNLHELAFGVSGVNPWFGTPANPRDPGRVPGGSSSGSAVAVALGLAEVALGSDTGGSVRIPAACCGVVGLKTTHGRVPLEGVWPLAPSYDTVGPLAASVAGIAEGMRLLLGSFAPAPPDEVPAAVGRLRLGPSIEIDPVIDAAVDEALRLAELRSVEVEVDDWAVAYRDQQVLLGAEAIESDGRLVEESGGAGISAETLERLARSAQPAAVLAASRSRHDGFRASFAGLVGHHTVVALATLPFRPPVIGESCAGFNALTAPVNGAGLPAISIPVPAAGRPPVGLQLVAAAGGEELLVSVAARIEAAVAG